MSYLKNANIKNTFELLKNIENVSPISLQDSTKDIDMKNVFSVGVKTVKTLNDVFQKLIQTSYTERLQIDEFLHGVDGFTIPDITILWRDEIEYIDIFIKEEKFQEKYLEECPIKSDETLKDSVKRIMDSLEKLRNTERKEKKILIINNNNEFEMLSVIEVLNKYNEDKKYFNFLTFILPPSLGCLSETGRFDDSIYNSKINYNVSKNKFTITKKSGANLSGFLKRFSIKIDKEYYNFYGLRKEKIIYNNYENELLSDHQDGVFKELNVFIDTCLDKNSKENRILKLSAPSHDIGKINWLWQNAAGNDDESKPLGKSNNFNSKKLNSYRHEFGAMYYLDKEEWFKILDDDGKNLCKHLIFTHHGRGRPLFKNNNSKEGIIGGFSEETVKKIINECRRRFYNFRKYSHYELSYLESMLIIADRLASKGKNV